MAIYTCFIQHVINSLKDEGKGAIVVPTGFTNVRSGVENKILKYIIDNKIVYGCISMPSNVFATTGTNVSVLFFDKSKKNNKVILIDASNMGEEYQEGKNKKRRLRKKEIERIINAFRNKETENGFSIAVSYNELKEKNYSLSAGRYFDMQIDYEEITEEEYKTKISQFASEITELFKENKNIEEQIQKDLGGLVNEKN